MQNTCVVDLLDSCCMFSGWKGPVHFSEISEIQTLVESDCRWNLRERSAWSETARLMSKHHPQRFFVKTFLGPNRQVGRESLKLTDQPINCRKDCTGRDAAPKVTIFSSAVGPAYAHILPGCAAGCAHDSLP